jgi:hypothetical protein
MGVQAEERDGSFARDIPYLFKMSTVERRASNKKSTGSDSVEFLERRLAAGSSRW